MDLGDDQLLELKDAIVNAFRPVENLFHICSHLSVDEGGETARLCSEIGLELARSFRVKLDAALERLTAETRRS
ncbi:hypothetical protein DFW101_2944 [Solidesulfovibrio carbinoliphilus subsp. oakridgensis]|uniref:Uncharacterized protein n=1 Tax=Solidesulfovibrio carbinoliphilus subsp. oakridgensis TaxID=694327 RepID=G7Q5E5_9BACT|nr:hypothetical protein DFW101_2944 [Solidesulfovibrio carbinoliphilus subsp. oakridgensis]